MELIDHHEGFTLDIRSVDGVSTIGFGFVVEEGKNRKRLEELGVSYHSVLSGNKVLNYQQLLKLMESDLNSAVSKARSWFKDFNKLSDARKAAIAYLMYSIGGVQELLAFKDKLSKVNYKKDSKNQDFSFACQDLALTKWAKANPRKSANICKILLEDQIKDIE